MCYLLDEPDTTTPVIRFRFGVPDLGRWMSLITGGTAGVGNVPLQDLAIVDMHYSGTAPDGFIGTWGQSGCTLILAIQTTGGVGRWAYFNHVTSNNIDDGVVHACGAISHLSDKNDIVFVLVGSSAETTFIDLLRRVRPQGARWRFLLLLKPENDLTESVLSVEHCAFSFTQGIVEPARVHRHQRLGFMVTLVPTAVTAVPVVVGRVTGHGQLDEEIANSTTRSEVWIDLRMLFDSYRGVLLTGVPEGTDPAGVRWMMQAPQLRKLLQCIKATPDYGDLDVDDATAKLYAHLQRMPPE